MTTEPLNAEVAKMRARALASTARSPQPGNVRRPEGVDDRLRRLDDE